MNKLKIPNPEAIDMGDSFGIPQERRDAISKGLDQMVKMQTTTSPARLVYASDILRFIESLCETEEERIWGIVLHLSWNLRTGRMSPTAEGQSAFIKSIGKPGHL